MNQQDHDRRSLQGHRLVVARMREHPEMLEQARATLDRWQANGPRPNREYLAKWRLALDSGIDAVELLATAQTEAGDALRQCSPISGRMPERDRWAFRSDWAKQHEAREP